MFFNLVSMLAIKDSGNAHGYMKYLGVDAYAFFVYKGKSFILWLFTFFVLCLICMDS